MRKWLEQLKADLKQCWNAARNNRGEYDFGIDLRKGWLSEFATYLILELDIRGILKVEVKTDFLVSETGNIFVEIEDRGKPSDLATTKADFWAIIPAGHAYMQSEPLFIFTTPKHIWNVIEAHDCPLVPGGDNKQARGYLVPLIDFVKPS